MTLLKNRIKIPHLHKKQAEIWQARKRYNIIKIGRRFGKTTFLENRCCGLASTFQEYTDYQEYYIGWFAPNYKFLLNSFNRIKKQLRPLIKSANQSNKTIELINGATIKFFHLETGDAGNGEKFHTVFIDEAGLSKALLYQWDENIQPTLLDYRGDAWIVGTPKGKNDYYELHERALTLDNWAIHTGTSYDNPFIDKAEIDELKKSMPEHIFSQEIMALFLNNIGNTFIINRQELERCFVNNPMQYHNQRPTSKVMGFDIASDDGGDTNAICMLNGNIVEQIKEHNNLDDILADISIQVDNGYKNIIYDGTGIGGNIHRDLKKNKAISKPFYFGVPPAGKKKKFNTILTNEQLFSTRAMQIWWYLQLRIKATCRYLDGENIPLNKCIFFDNNAPNKAKLIKELTQAIYLTNDTSSLMSVDKKPQGAKSPNLADSLIIALSKETGYGFGYF